MNRRGKSKRGSESKRKRKETGYRKAGHGSVRPTRRENDVLGADALAV